MGGEEYIPPASDVPRLTQHVVNLLCYQRAAAHEGHQQLPSFDYIILFIPYYSVIGPRQLSKPYLRPFASYYRQFWYKEGQTCLGEKTSDLPQS